MHSNTHIIPTHWHVYALLPLKRTMRIVMMMILASLLSFPKHTLKCIDELGSVDMHVFYKTLHMYHHQTYTSFNMHQRWGITMSWTSLPLPWHKNAIHPLTSFSFSRVCPRYSYCVLNIFTLFPTIGTSRMASSSSVKWCGALSLTFHITCRQTDVNQISIQFYTGWPGYCCTPLRSTYVERP